MPKFSDRLKHAWTAFTAQDRPLELKNLGPPSGEPPDKRRTKWMNERSIITAIYNRLAVDASTVSIYHVRVDENGNYVEQISDGLNDVLSVEANIDQTSTAFFRDLVYSMLDDGYICALPTMATNNPMLSDSYDIRKLRRGRVVEWYPNNVVVEYYDEITGLKARHAYPKKMIAIIENPFYSVMNAPNSTLQRLIRKLAILDAVDEQSGSGKLDMIIQLPYVVKSQQKRDEAEKRRKDIEQQLNSSKLGIAYIDGTERVIQLNRPVENNLMAQVEYLTNLLYSQLGITTAIMDGTADEKTMLNYYNRTIGPILDAVVDEFKRKFLTKTARTQGQSIKYFRDPFKLTPMTNLSAIAESLIGSGVLTSNEMRAILGYKPSADQGADTLMRRNTKYSDYQQPGEEPPAEPMEEYGPYNEPPEDVQQSALMHHGIVGQKWGKKNGPPYPLDQKTHDRVVKTGLGDKHSDTETHKYSKDHGKISKEVAMAALHLLALDPINTATYARAAIAKKKEVKYEAEREKLPVDPETGLHLKDHEYSEKDDIARVNPGFNDLNADSKTNCQACTATYEMRKRGYDVTAMRSTTGLYDDEVGRWFKKAKIDSVPGGINSTKPYSYDEWKEAKKSDRKVFSANAIQQMLGYGEGARGMLNVVWRSMYGMGHSVYFEVKNSKVRIIDAQSGAIFEEPTKFLNRACGALTVRLDNLAIDPENIKEVCF